MANNSCIEFKSISFNLHGYNQGENLLKEFCNDLNTYNPDCTCVQEHWLTPSNINKIKNISDNFSFYGISAMERQVENSVLVGRPKGGTGILLNNKWCKFIKFQIIRERFVLLGFESMILASLYLPCLNSVDDENIIIEILSEIEECLNSYPNHFVLLSGDFNATL